MKQEKYKQVFCLFGLLCSILLGVQARIQCNQGQGKKESDQFLECWLQEVTNGKTDLVFLMDRSGSMKNAGFQASKEFIRALLAEVRVAYNATRVAIVSFAWKSTIDINYIWNPNSGNHKCKYVCYITVFFPMFSFKTTFYGLSN